MSETDSATSVVDDRRMFDKHFVDMLAADK